MSSAAAGTDCHLLFTSRLERKRTAEESALLARASVLLVGDGDHFAAQGGAVGLVVKDRHLQMEINVQAAQRSSLNISSRILRLATLVEGGD